VPIDSKNVVVPSWHSAVKRLTDILISLAAIIILSPLLLFVAIRVLFSSAGPMLYSQERVGRGGKVFQIRKFRSMYVNAELDGPQLSANNDQRITSWGRFMRRWKLDELPQLWNVLSGDMSIVGPRPERAFYINKMEELTHSYKPLLQLKPGITSLGMIRFGYAGNVDEMIQRMKYDLIYLENNSLKMDLKIMVSTLRIIFMAKGS
jgi:lipopolysaccharide/colanic/teichoic acid biosynthesis glycosyltransferase